MALLELVKLGIGKATVCKSLIDINWQDLFDLADRHCVTAIALDGLNKYFEKGIGVGIDFQTKMEWIGAAREVEAYYKMKCICYNWRGSIKSMAS